MLDFIFAFIWSLLCHIAEGILQLAGSGWRKLAQLFRQANRT